MPRGDVVIVSAPGDYGKPRPAVVVQSDAFPTGHGSVIICQFTSTLEDSETFRVTVEPSLQNGLRVLSQIMVDKPTTLRVERLGTFIGRLDDTDRVRLDTAIAWVMGLGG